MRSKKIYKHKKVIEVLGLLREYKEDAIVEYFEVQIGNEKRTNVIKSARLDGKL